MDVPVIAEGRVSQDGSNRGSIDQSPLPTTSNGVRAEENDVGDPRDEDSKFQKAISAWRNIDLTNLMPGLDNTASEIVGHQRDSLVQRKDLAQKTKDFRKLDDAGKLGEYKSLLKAYQTFIDLLTNHNKTMSSAFLQLYTSLADAPDPYPLLEASVDSLLLSEETLPKLTSENEELHKSNNNLTKQLENCEKRLEEERKARKALEEAQENKIKEVEASWSAVLEEKQDNWEAKEKSLEDKVENQERLLKEIKASYEVTQRLGRADGGESSASQGTATAAELEIVHSELERTSLRLAEIEVRNEQLRVELAQSASQTSRQSAPSLEDDPTFLHLQSENSSLLRKLDAARLEKESAKRDLEVRLRGQERELASLKSDRDGLREKVQRWGDYDEVKRELEVLKSIEFATGDDDDDADGDATESSECVAGASRKGKGDDLEQLLMARNKKLSNELTVLRVSHQDLQTRLESLQGELSTTTAELERYQNLTERLEDDLSRVQQEASNTFPSSAMSVAGTYTSRHPSTQALSNYGGRRGRTSPTSSIISGFDPRGADNSRGGEVYGGGSGILPMITAQRDRFKQRNQQLEDDLSKSHTTISSLRSEIASLQKDNLDLYEKTRYVSTYNRNTPATASSSYAYSSNPNPSTIHVSSNTPSGLSLDRYRSAYEANVSPFAAFRSRESARAYKRMSLPERIVFSITRMVLANRTSRNLFAGYCLALHLLVFGMLYWMGTVDIEKHASNLGEVAGAAAAAAAAAAGQMGAAGGDASHGDWQQENFAGGQ